MIEDKAVELIREVHAQLEELQAEPLKLGIGALEKREHSAPPHVYWLFGSIASGPTDVLGGATAAIASDIERFAVIIWHASHEECRATRRNLIRALRIVACGPNFTLGEFDWLTEAKPAWMNLGHQLAGSVSLRLPMPKAPENFQVVTREITGQEHSVKLNDEEVC